VRTYEALFIIKDAVAEDRVKDVVTRLAGDIEKAGGRITETLPVGRRQFARPLRKKEGGYYVVLTFTFDEPKLSALSARYTLDEDVFRFQITRVVQKAAKPARAEAAAKPV
jgi:small subunit ribosomal protein S6